MKAVGLIWLGTSTKTGFVIVKSVFNKETNIWEPIEWHIPLQNNSQKSPSVSFRHVLDEILFISGRMSHIYIILSAVCVCVCVCVVDCFLHDEHFCCSDLKKYTVLFRYTAEWWQYDASVSSVKISKKKAGSWIRVCWLVKSSVGGGVFIFWK